MINDSHYNQISNARLGNNLKIITIFKEKIDRNPELTSFICAFFSSFNTWPVGVYGRIAENIRPCWLEGGSGISLQTLMTSGRTNLLVDPLRRRNRQHQLFPDSRASRAGRSLAQSPAHPAIHTIRFGCMGR
jgi:hypothetical protein